MVTVEFTDEQAVSAAVGILEELDSVQILEVVRSLNSETRANLWHAITAVDIDEQAAGGPAEPGEEVPAEA